MISNPKTLAATGPAPSGEPSARTPQEQQEYIQRKALKKARKQERLRSFFAWCWGCQSMGGSF